MSILIGFLYVIEVIVCLLLALVVMLQKPKDGGLGGAIGGGMLEASLGADAGTVLVKATATLGAIFLLNTLLLARLTCVKGGLMDGASAPVAQENPAAVMPQPAQGPVSDKPQAAPVPPAKAPVPAATAPVPAAKAPVPPAKAPVPAAKAPVPAAKAPVPPAKAPVPPVKAPTAPAKPVAK